MNWEADSIRNIATGMLAELDRELGTTRRFLERTPGDKLGWRPHEKSKTAGQLAFHIATLLKGVLTLALSDESELPNFREEHQPADVQEILSAFNESEQFVLKNLAQIDDARMHQTLKITRDGSVLMELPRVAFLRMVLLNHLYHHRGQYGVYLRLMGAKVPSSYGPSGDESPLG
ncbi:MAG: DinB family protein [Deltaproteobacteria bacterium]|nr:DinB family protein [Deltaproteobacteria bacterium]